MKKNIVYFVVRSDGLKIPFPFIFKIDAVRHVYELQKDSEYTYKIIEVRK